VFVRKWGTAGVGEEQFKWPASVAVASDGSVYVADFGNDRIQKFTSNGVFVKKWGTNGTEDGEFEGPKGVAVQRTVASMFQIILTTTSRSSPPQESSLANGARKAEATGSFGTRKASRWHPTVASTL